MSDLDLTDSYDPDAFERRPRLPAVPAGPAPTNREDALPGPKAPPAPAAAPGPVASPAAPAAGPVPWKGVASSVPRLREQPVAYQPSEAASVFTGFAQDAPPPRGGTMFENHPGGDAESRSHPDSGAPVSPLGIEPPFWELWVERARRLSLPLVLAGIGVVVAIVVLVSVLRPREHVGVSLAAIRQHPEAYDGRLVAVRGVVGESFRLGGNYVFNLRQGRDTIVVYSRTRNPAPHATVSATGTVSVGYLDGVPRVALLEQPPTP